MTTKFVAALFVLAFLGFSTSGFAQDAVDAHNDYRDRHCAPPLTWDAGLAAGAQDWANQCNFDHSKYAENLAASTDPVPASTQIDGWYKEKDNYNFSDPGFSMATGHFTQLVWKGTTTLGCGVATCPGQGPFEDDVREWTYYVCRYSPSGNVDGEYEQNVLDSTQCKSSAATAPGQAATCSAWNSQDYNDGYYHQDCFNDDGSGTCFRATDDSGSNAEETPCG